MPVQPNRNEKTIKMTVNFTTNGIAETGNVEPKVAWGTGFVSLPVNKTHGIKSQNPIPFNSFIDLQRAIAECLSAHGVSLQLTRDERKYRR